MAVSYRIKQTGLSGRLLGSRCRLQRSLLNREHLQATGIGVNLDFALLRPFVGRIVVIHIQHQVQIFFLGGGQNNAHILIGSN